MGAGLLIFPFALLIVISLVGLAVGNLGIGLAGLAGALAWLILSLLYAGSDFRTKYW